MNMEDVIKAAFMARNPVADRPSRSEMDGSLIHPRIQQQPQPGKHDGGALVNEMGRPDIARVGTYDGSGVKAMHPSNRNPALPAGLTYVGTNADGETVVSDESGMLLYLDSEAGGYMPVPKLSKSSMIGRQNTPY